MRYYWEASFSTHMRSIIGNGMKRRHHATTAACAITCNMQHATCNNSHVRDQEAGANNLAPVVSVRCVRTAAGAPTMLRASLTNTSVVLVKVALAEAQARSTSHVS